nr:hypothetical protein [Kibdelosporangium sp. MJ126-NF4]CEL16094.1 conserved hypothetical protein [Kibdelosporangium sp. MJ126-NF4]CTQ94020.1 conserved hypothetical protein [Kibdelosporangium sp. MJ126-NF4]
MSVAATGSSTSAEATVERLTVRGKLYARGEGGPVLTGAEIVTFDDPKVRWVQAFSLVRQLRGCTLISLEDLIGHDS